MSRFAINNNCLYAIAETNRINVFDISNHNSPTLSNEINVNTWTTLETLFKHENNLYIGAENGMYIYDISGSCNAVYVSDFQHARACDPIVVGDGYAYYTLRTGGACGNWRNTLNVVDVSKISTPRQVETISMSSPYGLGLDVVEKKLFVCDGGNGIVVYNTKIPENLGNSELEKITDLDAYDVIPLNGTLFVSGNQGIYQYDYVSNSKLKLLSVLTANQ